MVEGREKHLSGNGAQESNLGVRNVCTIFEGQRRAQFGWIIRKDRGIVRKKLKARLWKASNTRINSLAFITQ